MCSLVDVIVHLTEFSQLIVFLASSLLNELASGVASGVASGLVSCLVS